MKEKSTITINLIRKVADLAHLYLKKNELNNFKNQLANVFGFFERISKVKTPKEIQISHSLEITNRFREDKIDKERMLNQKQALSQAKRTYKGYFLVKSVFENE